MSLEAPTDDPVGQAIREVLQTPDPWGGPTRRLADIQADRRVVTNEIETSKPPYPGPIVDIENAVYETRNYQQLIDDLNAASAEPKALLQTRDTRFENQQARLDKARAELLAWHEKSWPHRLLTQLAHRSPTSRINLDRAQEQLTLDHTAETSG